MLRLARSVVRRAMGWASIASVLVGWWGSDSVRFIV
jgi:hypothetical protein